MSQEDSTPERKDPRDRFDRFLADSRIDQRRYDIAVMVQEGVRNRAEIARRLGVSRDIVSKDLAYLDKMWNEEGASIVGKMRDRERAISLQRYESYVQMALEELQSESPTIRLRALKQLGEFEVGRRRMLGLDMPLKTALTDPTGEQEYTGIPDHVKKRMMERFAEDRAETVPHEPVREIEDAEEVSDEPDA